MPDGANVLRYSLQVACIVAAAGLGIRCLPLASSTVRLGYWRGVLALCLLWPLVPQDAALPVVPGVVIAQVTAAAGSVWVTTPGPPLLDALPWCLLVGACLRLVWLAAGAVRLRTLRRTSVVVSGDDALEALRRDLAPRAEWRRHPDVSMPLTFGWRRPVVVLPERFDRLGTGARQAIACHELMHVARRDWCAVIAEELLCCVFWFHPAVRWVLAQVALTREQVIDEAVVRRVDARADYVAALATFAGAGPAPSPVMAFGDRSQVVARVRNLVAPSTGTRRQVRARALLLASLVLLVATTAAGALPLQESQRPVRVEGRIRPPRVLREVRPVYTDEAMQRKVQGEVVLDVVIARDGSVRDAAVVRSLEGLDQAAIAAARQWRFDPVRDGDRVVEGLVTLQFTFTLK